MSSNDSKKQKIASLQWLTAVSFLFPVVIAFIAFIIGGFAPFGTKDIFTASGNPEVFEYLRGSLINSAAVYNIAYIILLGLAGASASIFFDKRRKDLNSKKEENEKLRIDYIQKLAEKKAAKKEAKRAANKEKKDIKLGGTEAPRSHFGIFISKLDIIPFIFAMCFALGAHMLSTGCNILYLPSIALLPLILYGYDLLVNEKKFLTYLVSSMLSVALNPYITLVIFIFELLYGITLRYKDTRHMFSSYLRKAAADIILLVFSIPFILGIHNGTVYTDKLSLEFPSLGMAFNPFDLAKRYLLDCLPSNVSTYANNTNLYFGIGMLFLLLLYMLNKNIPVSDRIKNILVLVILTAGCNITTLNYLFGGFKNTGDICGAFNFVYIFFVLTLALEAMINIEHNTSLDMLISFLVIAGISIASLLLCKNFDSINPVLYTVQIIAIYFLMAILWKNDSMTKLLFQTGFVVLLLYELSFNYVDDMGYLGLKAKSYSDCSIGRIEATKEHIYESSPDANILYYEDFVTESNPFTNMILGITHVIAPKGSSHIDSMLEYSETINGYDIYTNPYCLKNGVLLSDGADEWSYSSEYPFNSFNNFSENLLDGGEMFEDVEVSSENINVNYDDILDVDFNLITNDKNANFIIKEALSGDIYATTIHSIHIGETDGTKVTNINQRVSPQVLNNTTIRGQFVSFNKANFTELYDKLSLASISVNGNDITVKADKDGFFLIPTENTGNYKVPGRHIYSMHIYDKNYILIPVSAGENHIVLSTTHMDMVLSGLYMLISLLMLFSVNILMLRKPEKLKAVYKNILNFVVNNKIYIYSIVITSVMFFAFVIYSRSYPFGNHSLIVSDGYVQYYPWFTSLFEHVRNGEFSLFNFHGGLSMDNYLMNNTILFNPINWPMLLFPYEKSYLGFVFVYYLRFILTGPVVIYYLTHRPGKKMEKNDFRLLVLSLCFSFSTYFIGYLCYYLFYDMALLFPICLLYMEKLLYEKKIGGFVISLSIAMFLCNYLAFIMCEFLFLYFFITKFDNIKDFFIKGLRFGLCSILSAGIAAAGLIPFYIFTTTSSYGLTDSLPAFSLSNSLISSISSIDVVATTTVVVSDFTRANSYMGLLLILCSGLYLINKAIPLSVRIRKFLLAFLLYFAYGNEFLNFVLHGFHKQSSVPNRFAIFFILLMISMLYDTLNDIKEISDKKGLITFLSSSVFFAIMATICYINDGSFEHITIPVIATYTFIGIYMILAAINHIKNPGRIMQKAFAFLLVSEVILTALFAKYMTTNRVDTDFDRYDNIKLLSDKYINTEAVERAEHISDSSVSNDINISYLLNNNSISCFSSLMREESTNTLADMGVRRTGVNYIYYNQGDPLSSTLLNMNYMYMSNYDINAIIPEFMEKVDDSDDTSLYKNPYSLSLGIFFEEDKNIYKVRQGDLNIYNSIGDYQNGISEKITGEKLYTKYEIRNNKSDSSIPSWEKVMIDDEFVPSPYNESKNVAPLKNAEITITIPKDITGDLYLSNSRSLNFLNTQDGENDLISTVTISFPIEDGQTDDYALSKAMESTYIYVLNESVLAELQKTLQPYTLTNISTGFNTIKGDFKNVSSGDLYLSLPMYPGYKAYLDGQKVDINSYMSALSVHVDNPGEHHIEIHYVTPGLIAGIIVSIISIIIFVTILMIFKKKNLKNKTGTEENAE